MEPKQTPEAERDPLALDDSWFDRPGQTLRREDVIEALRSKAPREEPDLDDDWFDRN